MTKGGQMTQESSMKMYGLAVAGWGLGNCRKEDKEVGVAEEEVEMRKRRTKEAAAESGGRDRVLFTAGRLLRRCQSVRCSAINRQGLHLEEADHSDRWLYTKRPRLPQKLPRAALKGEERFTLSYTRPSHGDTRQRASWGRACVCSAREPSAGGRCRHCQSAQRGALKVVSRDSCFRWTYKARLNRLVNSRPITETSTKERNYEQVNIQS